MNDDNLNNGPDGEEEEKFSDDPEEQLRIENDLLRLKLQAETGADLHQLANVPPEVENAFLNNILAFERQLDTVEEVSIFKLLGEPRDFRKEADLDDEEIEAELQRLTDLMSAGRIEVDFEGEYPSRLKYKFITEELFAHETQQFDIPDMVNHFIYEEFHPNHQLTITANTQDFLDMWLDKAIDEDHFMFGPEMVSKVSGVLPREKVFSLLRHLFDAYLSFQNGSYEIEGVSFQETTPEDNTPGMGFAEGIIQYEAMLESRETVPIKEPFKLYFVQQGNEWELMSLVMPGIVL